MSSAEERLISSSEGGQQSPSSQLDACAGESSTPTASTPGSAAAAAPWSDSAAWAAPTTCSLRSSTPEPPHPIVLRPNANLANQTEPPRTETRMLMLLDQLQPSPTVGG